MIDFKVNDVWISDLIALLNSKFSETLLYAHCNIDHSNFKTNYPNKML